MGNNIKKEKIQSKEDRENFKKQMSLKQHYERSSRKLAEKLKKKNKKKMKKQQRMQSETEKENISQPVVNVKASEVAKMHQEEKKMNMMKKKHPNQFEKKRMMKMQQQKTKIVMKEQKHKHNKPYKYSIRYQKMPNYTFHKDHHHHREKRQWQPKNRALTIM
mmetsp:Transcript_7934/g.11771  ORF Transcript_7934/g.11771 Transcript_7934/m.11771 type:complete len:162 (+) Transcript_7934:32-517(+)